MSHKFFENKSCEFYPCHDTENLNCLFCFCPLYSMEDCGGNYKIIKDNNGNEIKDCSDCEIPHKEENYDYIMEKLKQA